MAFINRSRKSGFVLRGGGPRRETVWIGITEAQNTIVAASTALISSSLNAAALALRPFTVVRTRGILSIDSDQIAASERTGYAFALAVVSDQAAAIGVSAVPTPITDRGSDLFFVYEEMFGHFERGDNTGFQVNEQVYRFDSKAMRKVNEDQDVVITKETSSVSMGVVATSAGRLLIKLH